MIEDVGETKDEVLRLLDEYARAPKPTGPVTLSPEYLAAVERWEALAGNAEGREKGWVLRAERSGRGLAEGARLLG